MDLLAQEARYVSFSKPSRKPARGSHSLTLLSGMGARLNGHNVAISHPEGRGLRDAMTKALQDAKVRKEDIDYVQRMLLQHQSVMPPR